MARTTYTIYGLIDPRMNELYYIGRTRRRLVERTDEHFFESAETLVSRRNQAILALGLVPGILKLSEASDPQTAFHAELYWIHFWTVQGTRLLNRETQPWFSERYETLFAPRPGESKRQTSRKAAAPAAPRRQGEPWTAEEEAAVQRKLRAGMTLADIARHADHQRSPHAIEQRVAKLRESGASKPR